MPYPVPPPTPPPVIQVLQSEEISSSVSTSPVTGSSRQTTTPTPSSALIASTDCTPEPSASCSGESAELLNGASSNAESLGLPVETGTSPVQPATFRYGIAEIDADIGAVTARHSLPRSNWGSETFYVGESLFTASPSEPAVSPRQSAGYSASSTASSSTTSVRSGLRSPALAQVNEPETIPGTTPETTPGSLIEPPSQPIPPGETEPETVPPGADDPDGEVLIIPEPGAEPAPSPDAPENQTPAPATMDGEIVPLDPSGTGGVIELTADRQRYDTLRRVFIAEGNVQMTFQNAVLTADYVRVNLPNRIAVAEGNAILTRGDQVLRGDRFEYNFVQEQGTVLNARGEVFLETTGEDLAPTLPTDVSADANTQGPIITQRIALNQPVVQATTTGGITATIGGGSNNTTDSGIAGAVNRLRFEAEEIDFTADGWVASNVRLTNDPFSPPELELRANQVTFTRESPTRSVIRARNPRVVFDQGFSLPLLRDRVVLDERERNPAPIQFGFDEEERGGFFLERAFEPIVTPAVRFSITPQFYLQRALSDNGGNFFDPSNYGFTANLNARIDRRTALSGGAVLTTLDPDELEDELRASLRLRRRVGTHSLALEYSYRDRLFNGSLGFQDVRSSLGFVLTSPTIALGTSGINLSYQVGAQYVTANTDREELLPPPPRDNNRASLTRVQASAALNRGFLLWVGTPLPATPTEGLRYTPTPVVPYLQAYTGVRGVLGYYSNGETQTTLTGTVGLQGQFGNFSRDFLDYTAFNLAYSQTIGEGESPFFFDRANDRQVLSLGLVQQVYGPFRFGFQTSINLDRDREIDTDYILEYSRRTYAITLRYNPVREVGSLALRISDFNWTGDPGPFSNPTTGVVEGGVRRSGD